MFTEPKIVAKDHAPIFIVWFTTAIAGDTPHMAINSDKISTSRNVRSTTKMFQRRYCLMSFVCVPNITDIYEFRASNFLPHFLQKRALQDRQLIF
ncbi:MAG: hypothetical protein WBZ36_22735 [Candidatus Nitrosopolaris sp.]